MLERAPAKVNLCLYLGPTRADGRHELVTLFSSVDLVDTLDITVTQGDRDLVLCEAVPGPNLVAEALARLRVAGWSAPPVQVRIAKRIPVAAGMGGGSADAAAMLRAAPRLAPIPDAALSAIAAGLGADVPSQLDPGLSLGTGAGERVAPLADVEPHGVLVLPQRFGLSTAEVYREADRLGLPRPWSELALLGARLGPALPARLVNDLQPAALSLAPAIAAALAAATDAGADDVLVCGSGPTAIGVFRGTGGLDRARRAAEGVRATYPDAAAIAPVSRGVGPPAPND